MYQTLDLWLKSRMRYRLLYAAQRDDEVLTPKLVGLNLALY